MLAWVAAFAAPAAAEAVPAGAAAPPSSGAGSPGIENTPLDIVILVDESGSESSTDVRHEIEAASTIAQAPLNPRSRVTVAGFGGANGAAKGQDPTSVVCQPTVASGISNLEYLARCVGRLHRRTRAEGDTTDYVAALAQALSLLGPGSQAGARAPAGAFKAVLMMTDGGLDETGNPSYPQPAWQNAARHAVDLQLSAARSAGVSVWPLGFGSIPATAAQYLGHLATAGGHHTCDTRRVTQPHAIIAQDSARALDALYSLFASATCMGVSHGGQGTVQPGQPRRLTVSIPAIASGGAISVNKGAPGIRVEYFTPDGTEVTGGSLGKSSFVRSGQDTAVEVLHITNPQPGPWQVQVTAPPHEASQLVSVTAFWQGAVRVSIEASPPTALPGQRIGVVLSVLGPEGPITDPAELRNMQVRVTVTGDGLPTGTPVPVHAAGGGGGSGLTAGDYTGTFQAPTAAGTLTVHGTAAGYGLYATEVPAPVTVSSVAALLQGTVQFTAPDTVVAGQAIHGKVTFTNRTGSSQRVDLVLTAAHALASLTAPRGVLTVPSGTTAVPFTISLASGSPIGTAQLAVKAVSADDRTVPYGNQSLLVTVRHPPGLIGKYRWELTGVAVLLLLVALALYLRARERRRITDVRDLLVSLSRDGAPLGQELKAPGKEADTLRFMIRDEDGPDARLDYPQHGDRPYVARRGTEGRLRVRPTGRIKVVSPGGDKYDIALGPVGEPLPNGAYLAFRDRRHLLSQPLEEPGAGPGRPAPTPSAPPSDPAPYDPWD